MKNPRGFRGHLVISLEGVITGFSLTPASGSEREAVWEITNRISGLLIGDKGYLSSGLQQDLLEQSLNLQTPKRSNMVESRVAKPCSKSLSPLGQTASFNSPFN